MHWVEKLPWWVKWAFAGGTGLLSAFASVIIPGWGQIALFWIGAASMFVAAVGTARHLLRRSARPSNDQFRPRHCVPMWQIVQRVALIIGEDKDTNFFPKSRATIRQAAADGYLTIRGRRQIGSVLSVQRQFDTLFSDIPRTYWEEFEIGPYAAVPNEFVNNPYTQQIVRQSGPNSHDYAELQALEADVETLWPLNANIEKLSQELVEKGAVLERKLAALRANVRERTAERDVAENELRAKPSPDKSTAYQSADANLGRAWSEHDAIRDELLRVRGAQPAEDPYMNAHEVLHYLADISEWGEQIRLWRGENAVVPEGALRKQPLLEAPGEFKRVAQQGKIAAVGRLNGKGLPTPIPDSYWMVATISPFSLHNPEISETVPAVPDPEGIALYKAVRISRADVCSAWPRARSLDEVDPDASPLNAQPGGAVR